VVLFVLFGGAGTLIGAVIGVTVIEHVSFALSQQLPGIWPVVLGILLLLIIMFRPSGLVGFLVSERERIGSFGRRTMNSDGPRGMADDVTS
jgi:branched-chain amino acid transport system permease protein